MPVVFVADEQDDEGIDTQRWLRLANDVLRAEKVQDEIEVSVIFVDDKTIADLNEKFMGKTGPTDVLSFPIDDATVSSGRQPDGGGVGPGGNSDDDEDGPMALLGDVVICPKIAKARAPEHTGTLDNEIALLTVHGLLHLLGMDHEDEEEARAMEARERNLLDEFYEELPANIWSTMSDDEPDDETGLDDNADTDS